MREASLRIDAVVCSPAARTVETWEIVSTALPDASVRYADTLYLGSYDAYMLEAELEEADTVMIVGHNPTCAAIVGGFRHANGFDGRYAPGTLCCAVDRTGTWTVEQLIAPRDLVHG